MEPGRDNSASNVDLRTSTATNLGEGAQSNSGKKLAFSPTPSTTELTSQDHLEFLLNAATTSHPGATSEFHHTSSVAEKGDGSTINSHLETHYANPFGEDHSSALGNKSEPSSLSSHDHLEFLSNATTSHSGATSAPTHEQGNLQSELHHTSSETEKVDGSTINSHLEARHDNPFGEAHSSALGNNSAPSSSVSSSKNPFLRQCDATNNTHVDAILSEKVHDHGTLEPELNQTLSVMQQGNGGMTDISSSSYPVGSLGEKHYSSAGEMSGFHSSSAPSAYESSQVNPFEVPTNTTIKAPVAAAVSQEVDENHDHGHELYHTLPATEQGSMLSYDARIDPANTVRETHFSSSSHKLGPSFTSESAQSQQLANATDNSNTHNGLNVPANVESYHTSSVTEQGHQSMVSSSNLGTNSVAVLGDASGLNPDHKFGSSVPSEQGHQSMACSSNLGTNSVAVFDEATVSNPDNKLGSSVPSSTPASETSSRDPMHSGVNAASYSKRDTSAPPKLGLDSVSDSESSQISSIPKHGKSSDVAGKCPAPVVPGTNNASEIQNPPVQVMERSGNPATPSSYRFPSHVFARNKSNAPTEWSTASNESLFSIQMGTMSFICRDPAWLSKYGESEKHMSGVLNSSSSNLPPISTVNKFNDMSQRTAELHEGSRVTEAKAEETMREITMEISKTTENMRKGDLSLADGVTRSDNKLPNSNKHSQHSNGSTTSFAFRVSTDGDKTVSSKDVEEKRKQQSLKEKPDAAQTPKSTRNASQNSLLSCFPCCTFCH